MPPSSFRPNAAFFSLLLLFAAASLSLFRPPSDSCCVLAFFSPLQCHRPPPASSSYYYSYYSSSSEGGRRSNRRRHHVTTRRRQRRRDDDGDGDGDGGAEEEARRLRRKAEELREQVRELESKMDDERAARGLPPPLRRRGGDDDDDIIDDGIIIGINKGGKSLRDKRVLIVGANGRLGSMIVRRLLRTHPEVREVVAAVHYVGTSSTRGYGRLSYEVGAEDGIGTIGSAWSGGQDESNNARFVYDPDVMSGYNLNKLRVVEVELLDPVQVRTITEDVDSIIYCATDFEGNRPRAVSSLDVAFLFRAVANPTKGRVEVEGVRNCLEGLVGGINERRYRDRSRTSSSSGSSGANVVLANDERGGSSRPGPTQFVLVSTSPDAYGNFETPFGEFNGLKRLGEITAMEEFPSITRTVLQMGKFDDNFVAEGQELLYTNAEEDTVVVDGVVNAVRRGAGGVGVGVGGNFVNDGMQKRINRRDAARAAVEALLDEDIEGKKVQVYTTVRKTDIW